MNITVLKESLPDENRVALMPDSIKKLIALGATVKVEKNAGKNAGAIDDDYVAAGATVYADKSLLLNNTEVLVSIHIPQVSIIQQLKPHAVAVGFFRPLDEPEGLLPFLSQNTTAIALELIPRSTRAQAMDALSSMATVVGYKAVLLAAARTYKMFPLLMTAAGTVPPAKVLILGAGVAGLQAIATARRLGAVVEAYDVRAAAGEQVRSLGATFLEVDLGGIQTEDSGGYAKELSEEALNRGRALVAKHAKMADVIITTAQVPGRRAPVMLTKEAVDGMKGGAIIVDLASSSGGNCALTKPGQEIIHDNGVIIMAPLNLAASVPLHASQLYSRNLTSLLQLMIKNGSLNLDMNDDIIAQSCVVHHGNIVNARVKALLDAEKNNSLITSLLTPLLVGG